MTPHRLGTCEAHPRVSGENLHPYQLAAVAHGSSPRERGKLFYTSAFVINARLIPA